MKIELQNCSLEIGHIGTRQQIAMEELCNSLMAVGKAIVDAFTKVLDDIRPVMEAYIKATTEFAPIPPAFYGLHRI